MVQLARETQASNGFFPFIARTYLLATDLSCSLQLGHRKFHMKTKLLWVPLLFALSFSPSVLHAGTPAQEKEFTEKYKKAFEANDTATLYSFLYTKDANQMALGFYKMMMTNGAGEKISKIELVDLAPEDAKKAAETQDGPGGMKTKLPLQPTKKLKITVEQKDANGSSSSTSESFIAEKDGKFVIPVPVDAK